jgi:hypothetical protein
MNWPEEKLLYQAEQAATKCGLCNRYGDHYTKDCPTLTEPLLTREVRVRAYAELRDFTLWLFVFWFVLGFCVGMLATLLWKGLEQ